MRAPLLVLPVLVACGGPHSTAERIPAAQDTMPALPPGFTVEPTEDSTTWAFRYEDLLFEGRRRARFKVLKAGTANEWQGPDTAFSDTLYKDKRFMILGRFRDSDMGFRQYATRHRPEMYPAVAYTGPLAKPIIYSDRNARAWRTVIRRDCEAQGVNFAGHYTIAEWGCGAMCQILAVVDRKDGRVYFSDIPFDTLDGHYGARYGLDSRLIVVNSELVDQRPGYRTLLDGQWPSTYVWDEDRKRFDLVETVRE